MFSKNKVVSLVLLLFLLFNNVAVFSAVDDIQAVQTENCKYPDYSEMYAGVDKYEKFNRKMFNLNSRLNKYVARPVHILWSSIMPKYGMDRIKSAYNNIEYPKRLASCILQRDGDGVKKETVRFLTNSTIGLGGLFDPADKLFKVKPTNENMEQALCKCKMHSGTYLVMPILNSCTPRSLCGRALEAALDPSVYLATPLTGLIKFGLMVNRTSYMQPLAKMIEATYADPYDIQKKMFGLENYIRNANLDREDLISQDTSEESSDTADVAEISDGELLGAAANLDIIKKPPLDADIQLDDFHPQSPVVDSMRTALFEDKSINKSIWNELSLWNRSFAKRIKSDEISVDSAKDDYVYRYILQKDKKAPLVILYPSIGEGSNAHHSIIFAKMFYDMGYSVVIQGSHFHWEFVKSMPDGYCPGVPARDAEYVRLVTSKILESICSKYGCEFSEKVVVGTSFGAMVTLFVAEKESKNNILNVDKFIAISPPIELVYALEQLDKNGEEFDKNSPEVKHKTAITAAKILQLSQLKENSDYKIDTLPFSDEEGKLITTFILRQKLSDLVFAIEKIAKGQKTDFYEKMNNMNYRDYAEKYLVNGGTLEDMRYSTSLYSLAEYLVNNDNYKIYHSFDDYFTNMSQIAKLKNLAGTHLVCLNNGAHLGFLYRKEFIDDLRGEVEKGYSR